MAPGHSLIDNDENSKPNYALKVEPNQGNHNLLAKSNGKGLMNMIKQEETSVGIRGPENQINCCEEEEVDIIGGSNDRGKRLAETEDPDATDCSSSFGDTFSDSEKFSEMSEGEVESKFFCEGALPSPYEALGCSSKKLTTHWRNFIRPLMWRCKWTELKVREIESQELKYTRKIASYDQKKHNMEIDQAIVENFGSKSLPVDDNYRRKIMKRRKRKKVEETTDVASYFSQHNIFSYLENKKSNIDISSMADDFMNTAATAQQHVDADGDGGPDHDAAFLDFKDGYNSLEPILSKIEMAHSLVHNLRSQLEVVMAKHTPKFSSSENISLLAPNDGQTSSARSPTFSAGNGDNISAGAIYNLNENMEDYDMGELVLPDGSISSYGEAFHIPDIIESTVGLLAAADVKPQIGDPCDDIMNNLLIHNQATDGDSHMFTGTSDHQPTVKLEKVNVGESSNPSPAPDTSHEQSALPSNFAADLHFATNKRKRGERKAGSGSWKNKAPGEPDKE
ncbi:hypothetical protein ACFE04_007756 [Oxalis oulophora]